MRAWVERLKDRLPPRAVDFGERWWKLHQRMRIEMMAADAAFWFVFSLPWMVLAVVASLGFVSRLTGWKVIDQVQNDLVGMANSVLSQQTANDFVVPRLNELFSQGRAHLGVIGIVIAFYSGSRAFKSLLASIRQISGLSDRGAVHSRAVGLAFYVCSVALISFGLATITAGTDQIATGIGAPRVVFQIVDPLIFVILILLLVQTLLHIGMRPRLSWKRDWLPAAGAVLVAGACLIGIGIYLRIQLDSGSVLGLAEVPIAVMLFCYVASWVVLNAAALQTLRQSGEVTQPTTA